MEALKNRVKELFVSQEVRITAALQLILCFLALSSTVSKEIRTNQKKRKKAAKKKKQPMAAPCEEKGK